MTGLVQILVDGLSLGAIYALYALGVALVFGVSGIVNFAYGNFIAAGAHALLVVGGLAWPLASLAVILLVVAIGLVAELSVFAPARRSGADATSILIAAFALSVAIESGLLLVFGARPTGVDFGASLSTTLEIGGIGVGAASVVTVGVVAAALAGLAALLRWSRIGLLIRAAALDAEMLRLLGIRSGRIVAATVALSSALAGIASLLLVAQTGSLSLGMGVQPVLIAFIGTVLGGLGSLVGAVVAAFALAFATVGLQEFLPRELTPFRTAFLFALIIAALLARPDGLVRRASGARI